MSNNADITNQLADSLAWIVTFCQEHSEWFGEAGIDTHGAEHEWLRNADNLIKQFNDPQAQR